MHELIESKVFVESPDVSAKDFVDYFNLEFGMYPAKDFQSGEIKPFVESDFKFLGYFKNKSGQESVYWSVNKRDDLFAEGLPLTNGKTLLSMTDVNPSTLTEIELTI